MPSPVKVTLVIGEKYLWCANIGAVFCEKRECHGRQFTADRTEAFICTCKETKTPPFCDGSHKTVKDELPTD